MKLRRVSGGGPDKVEMQMTPMIDIVFQLLTFFLFSFKIATVEGDFNIKMPVASSGAAVDNLLPAMKITLKAGPGGQLAGIQLNDKTLGTDFKALHNQILSIVGGEGGPRAAADDLEVELDCDYNLKYENVVKAITALSGYLDDQGNIIKLIQKIKFAPPKPPG